MRKARRLRLELRLGVRKRTALSITIDESLLELWELLGLKSSRLGRQPGLELGKSLIGNEACRLGLQLHLLKLLLLHPSGSELIQTLTIWRLACPYPSKLRLKWLNSKLILRSIWSRRRSLRRWE